MSPADVLDQAVAEHHPVKVFAMFSGGHDSVTSTHIASQHSSFSGVLHVNTGIGIEETREYVRAICTRFGWPLTEAHAPQDWYEQNVLEHGMPGGPMQHGIVYQRLKDDQIRAHVRTYQQRRGDRIGLVTGARTHESERRMRVHPEHVRREGGQLWINPILEWTALDVNAYMAEHDIPRNPVVDKLHRSGECLCGALARPEELNEIEFWFPEVAQRIKALEFECFKRNLPHNWGTRQSRLDDEQQPMLPLCRSCQTRWEAA